MMTSFGVILFVTGIIIAISEKQFKKVKVKTREYLKSQRNK